MVSATTVRQWISAARRSTGRFAQTDPNGAVKAWLLSGYGLKWMLYPLFGVDRLCSSILFPPADRSASAWPLFFGLARRFRRQLGDRPTGLCLAGVRQAESTVSKSLCAEFRKLNSQGCVPPPPRPIAMVARRQGFSPSDAWKLSSPRGWPALPRRSLSASPPFGGVVRMPGCPAPDGAEAGHPHLEAGRCGGLWPVLLVRQPYTGRSPQR